MDQKIELAYNFIQYTQDNLFVTGKAGTGKTTFLRKVMSESSKKMVVVAPTGVAAIQANGVTMHSLFQLPFGLYIGQYKKQWGVNHDNNIVNEHQLLTQLRINSQKRQVLQNVELIIVDEVSMVRADYMDAMDAVLRFVRRNDRPFGGCQMMFIGDMFQLPPVVQNHDRAILSEYYDSSYFFDSHVLKNNPPICIEFDKIFRQTDQQFINLLNNVRNNSMDQDDFDLLQTRYYPHIDSSQDQVITISSHNGTVDQINSQALNELRTKSQMFKADVTGEFPENAFPMPVELELREGAQVMFTKNDKGDNRRYYNGKIGKITRINKFDNEITIEFKNEGNSITIEPEKWENVRYSYDEANDKINETVIGTFQQFPLKLAWAVTIHKSQGMTFDEAIVDAGKSFAPGQVYVALSRLRSLEGLYLKSQITPQSVMIDPKIIEFFDQNTSHQGLDKALLYGQLSYLENELVRYFDFRNVSEELNHIAQSTLTDATKTQYEFSSARLEVLQSLQELERNGYKFMPFIHDKVQQQDWVALNERFAKAVGWYEEKINAVILGSVQEEIEKLKVQKNTTKLIQTFHKIKMYFKRWLQNMLQYKIVVNHIAEDGDVEVALKLLKDKSLLPDLDDTPTPSKLPSHLISVNLFRKHKSIEKVCEERQVKESTIYSHFTKAILEKELDMREVLDDEKFLTVLDCIKKHPNESSVTFYKSKLPDTISFDEIRMVIAHIAAHKMNL